MIIFLLLASKFHATAYVSSDGTDAESCGTLLAPCKTVQYALNSKASDIEILTTSKTFTSYSTDHIAASITSSVTISGTPTLTFEQKKTCFTVSGTSVEVEISSASAKVMSNSQYLTTSATGEVYLSELHIYGSPSVTLSSSLISATAGELYLNEVVVYKITLNNSPLISAPSTSYLEIDDSTFNSITRNSGDGSVVSYTITENCPYISGKFEFCRCKNGNGGVIALTIAEGTEDIKPIRYAEITGCSASGSGGAVSILSHRNANVTLSSFDCDSPSTAGVDGGLLYLEADNSTIFKFVLPYWFEGVSHAGRDGGVIAAVFNGEGGYLEITTSESYSSFRCSGATAKRNGGAISVVGGSSHKLSTLLQILVSHYYTYCTAGENGGAISYIQNGKGGFEFPYSFISSCSASKNGGGMYLDIQGEATLSFDSSISCYNNTAQTGTSVYLNTNQDTLTTSAEWRKIVDYSLQRTNVQYLSDGSDDALVFSSEVPNTFVIAGSKSSSMDQIGAVSITGKELTTGQTCPTNACKTLSDYLVESPSTDYRYHRLQYSSTGTVKEEGELLFTSNNFVISGYGTDQKTVLTLSSGTLYRIRTYVLFKYLSFTVSTGADTKPTEKSFYSDGYGTLNFFHCSVSAEQQSAELSSELIYLSYGNLVIMSSTFTGMTFATDTLIKADYSTTAYFLWSTFTNIESKNEDESAGGSVYFESSSTNNKLYCIASTFKSCKSASNGGVIRTTGMVSLESSLSDENAKVTFDGCTAARNGGAIYLDLSSITSQSSSLRPYCVAFTSTTAKQSGNHIYALVNSEYYTIYAKYSMWEFKPTAVKQFIVASTDTSVAVTDIFDLIVESVTVSQSGVDSETCGSSKSAKPCATIYGAINTYDRAPSEITVEAGAKITETEYSYMPSPVTVRGSSTNTPTILVSSPTIYFDIYADVTFTSLAFEMSISDSASYSNPLFSGYYEDYTLTLDSLTIYGKNPKDVYTSRIVSCYCQVTIKNCAFANFTLKSDPLIRIPEVFVCSGNTFTNIVRNYGNGAVFSAEIGYDEGAPLSLSNCKFDQCVCNAGNGGAVFITASQDARVTLSHLTFTKCEARGTFSSIYAYDDYDALVNAVEADAASGGGLAFDISYGEPASLSFSDMSFSGCKATHGSQMAAYTTYELTEDILYSGNLWEGLLSGDTADNEFLLAVHDTTFSSPVNSLVFKSTKQLSDVAPAESGSKSTVIIIVVVVVVVVVIVVVAVIIVCILRSKQKACFAPKNESSADKQANESEMNTTNETPKEQTNVDVPPQDAQPANQ